MFAKWVWIISDSTKRLCYILYIHAVSFPVIPSLGTRLCTYVHYLEEVGGCVWKEIVWEGSGLDAVVGSSPAGPGPGMIPVETHLHSTQEKQGVIFNESKLYIQKEAINSYHYCASDWSTGKHCIGDPIQSNMCGNTVDFLQWKHTQCSL